MEMKPRFVALGISVLVVLLIVELVRRRRLREEYSWLWLFLSMAMLVLALWRGFLDFLTDLMGAVLSTSTLFFFALLSLMLISIQFSVEISSLRTQVKNLAQQLAILQDAAQTGPLQSEGEDHGD
jgi:hypothetical protein